LEGLTKDVVVEACNGAPDSTHSNCIHDVVSNVLFDDAESGANPQTSAGDLTSPTHGDSVSNNGFCATASTSPEQTDAVFGLESGDDSTNPGFDVDISDSVEATNPTTSTATAKTWNTCDFDTSHDSYRLSGSSDSTQALTLYSGNTSFDTTYDNACVNNTNSCAMDRIWLASGTNQSQPVSAAINFPEHPNAPSNCQEIARNRAGTVGARPAVTTATNSAGSNEDVQGCLFDQSGNPVTYSNNFAFQLTPETQVGTDFQGFEGCDGSAYDVNGNNFYEAVDGEVNDSWDCGDSQTADQQIYLEKAGSYSVTSALTATRPRTTTRPRPRRAPASRSRRPGRRPSLPTRARRRT